MMKVLIMLFFASVANASISPVDGNPSMILSLHSCILATGKNYFTRDNIIAIFLNKAHFFETLLQELSELMKWPLAVITEKENRKTQYDPKLQVPLKNVIMIWKSNFGSKVLRTFFWHHPPIVKIIVVCDNSSQVDGIIETLWKGKAHSAVLLVLSEKNDEEFHVYKWYPRQRKNCGKAAGVIKLVDRCFHGKFDKNAKLPLKNYPLKGPSRCNLVTGYVKIPPYVIDLKNNTIGSEDYIDTRHGLEVNLVNLVAKRLNLNVTYIESGQLGDIKSDGEPTGALRLLRESKIDIAIGSYTVTLERSYFFRTITPYKVDILAWCVPHYMVANIARYFINYKVVLVTGVTLVLLSVSLWYFGKLLKTKTGDVMSPGEVFLCTVAVLAATAVKHETKTSAIRLIFLSAVCLGFYINVIMQSHLISALSNTSYREKFGSYQFINENNLTKYYIPNIERYFQDPELKEIRETWIECHDREKCLRKVATRKNSAYCVPLETASVISRKFVSPTNEPLLHCFGRLVPLWKTLLVERGFHLFPDINKLVGRIREAGLISKWQADIRNFRKRIEVYNLKLRSDEGRMLTFEHLAPVFECLMAAHCFSILVFVIELLVSRRRIPFIN